MTPDEFKQWGHRFVDWMADYLSQPDRHAVLSRVKPGDIRKQLPAAPPEHPESFELVFQDLDRIIVPGLTHWNHPSFLAYFPNTGSEPGIFGEMLTAAFNVNGMLWRTSPAATELEEHVLDWLRQMMGLPDSFMGMICDTASMATFHALAAARERVGANTGRSVRDDGICGPGTPVLRIYASEQAHSSVEKSAMALGTGRRGLVKVGTDPEYRMDVAALESAIQRDRREGVRPFAVVATVGTTSTTSVDPVGRIADVCEKHGLWLHVDAAYAGSAAIIPELRYVLEGCDRADSFVANPHKWLLTPMDLSAFYCRRPEMLKRAFSLTPDYLKTPEGDAVTNMMDYTLQLGRRFRSLKLWMIIRHYGVEGLRSVIREHIRLAALFADLVKSDARFEVVAPVLFSTVCFRLKAGDGETQAMIDRVNASGKVFISHTTLGGKVIARLAIGNARTKEEHIRGAWDVISQ
jgi:aromatic-L-amino-acid/L-tryptophan decarboxylase